MTQIGVVYFSGTGTTKALAAAIAAGAEEVATTHVHAIEGADIDAGRWRNDAIAAELDASDA
ncbi:MAG: flavodoxin family protein, partial [Pseudomonadota bacterium]